MCGCWVRARAREGARGMWRETKGKMRWVDGEWETMGEEKAAGEEERTEAQEQRDTQRVAETQRECQRPGKAGCEDEVPDERSG